jgi:GPH family glycoside/pentoside/hexuronide:cation symporter
LAPPHTTKLTRHTLKSWEENVANETGDKPAFSEKLGYGMGDTASNIVFQGVNILLLYFYTDVMGLAPATVALIFVGVRIWDTVNDPVMGIIADRTQTKHGKYRPYLLWMAVPFGLVTFLTFAAPSMSEPLKIAYATVTYLILMMVYTAINVPYSALMGVMTSNSEQRTILSSYRFVGAFTAGLIISMAARPMVSLFGGGQGTEGFDEALGFRLTFLLLASLATILFLVTFFTTKERVAPPKVQDQNIRKDVEVLLQNRAWLVMAAAGVLTLSNVAVRNAVTFHFFKYYVGDDGSAFFLFLDQTSLFLTLGSLAFIAGLAFTKTLARVFGKRNALIGLTVLNAITMMAFFFIPPEAYWVMVGVNIVGSLLAGPTPALVWAMYADVADYGEWRSGRRSTGLVFSAAMFAQKMGLTIGGAGAGALLGLIGFVANQDQTPEALEGLRVIFSLVPGGLALCNGLVLLLYPIREETVEQMGRELAASRA